MWNHDSGGHCSAINLRGQNPEQVMLQLLLLQRRLHSLGREGKPSCYRRDQVCKSLFLIITT